MRAEVAVAAVESTMTLTYSTKNIYARRQLSFAELACAMMNGGITVSQCRSGNTCKSPFYDHHHNHHHHHQQQQQLCCWLLPIRSPPQIGHPLSTCLVPWRGSIKVPQLWISQFGTLAFITFASLGGCLLCLIASLPPFSQLPRTQSPPSTCTCTCFICLSHFWTWQSSHTGCPQEPLKLPSRFILLLKSGNWSIRPTYLRLAHPQIYSVNKVL